MYCGVGLIDAGLGVLKPNALFSLEQNVTDHSKAADKGHQFCKSFVKTDHKSSPCRRAICRSSRAPTRQRAVPRHRAGAKRVAQFRLNFVQTSCFISPFLMHRTHQWSLHHDKLVPSTCDMPSSHLYFALRCCIFLDFLLELSKPLHDAGDARLTTRC